MLAFFTKIVRRKRIDLSNSHSISSQRRAYRASRAYEISVVVGFFNQLIRYPVQNCKAVLYYRTQLSVQSLSNKLGQRSAVAFAHSPICQLLYFFCISVYNRHNSLAGEQLQLVSHFSYFIRRCYNYLARSILAQI